MSVIADLKEELKRISPWPWEWEYAVKSGPCALVGKETDVFIPTIDADDYCFVDISEVHNQFIARSPERIAALVEYVEANELTKKHTEDFCNCKPLADCLVRLQAARKKLGLG